MRLQIRLLALLPIVLAVTNYGCSIALSPKFAPPEAVQEAMSNTPPPGMASMYLIRPSRVPGAAVCYFAAMDNTWPAGLPNGAYLWDPISPGKHVLLAGGKTPLSFEAEAGRTYYFMLQSAGPFAVKVTAVPEENGKEILEEVSLYPAHWYWRQYLANWPKVHVGMKEEEVAQLLPMPMNFATRIEFTSASTDVDKPILYASKLGFKLEFSLAGILVDKTDAPAAGGGRCP